MREHLASRTYDIAQDRYEIRLSRVAAAFEAQFFHNDHLVQTVPIEVTDEMSAPLRSFAAMDAAETMFKQWLRREGRGDTDDPS
jgi:hypothetical protein